MEQTRCLSVAEQILKMWYIHTTEYYSTVKKSKITKTSAKYMELETSILCKITHSGNLVKGNTDDVMIYLPGQ